MAIQKDEALTEPLSLEEAPKLFSETLKPSLSQASLNLIIDYRRTLQADLNKLLFWNYKTSSLLVLFVSGYIYFRVNDALKYRTFDLVLKNREFQVQLFYVFIAVVMIISMGFALLGEYTKFIKEDADKLVEDPTPLFGFDLKHFASLPDDEAEFKLENEELVVHKKKKEYSQLLQLFEQELKHGENTQLIIYREKPIAVITIAKDEELTREDQFAVRINGIGVRRVYANTGLQKDLIQWTYLRARDMYLQEHPKLTDDSKPLRIFIEVYNFEHRLLGVLKTLPGWQLIRSERVADFVLGSIYGVEKQTWAIGMNLSSSPK